MLYDAITTWAYGVELAIGENATYGLDSGVRITNALIADTSGFPGNLTIHFINNK